MKLKLTNQSLTASDLFSQFICALPINVPFLFLCYLMTDPMVTNFHNVPVSISNSLTTSIFYQF